MKNLVHLFSREVVLEFLDSLDEKLNFELIAALMMQRLYEDQWHAPTMIGFYLSAKYHDLLGKTENRDRKVLRHVLKHGIKKDHQIDFVIASEAANSLAEFQLKRFGIGEHENTTDGLIAYLNKMERQYVPIDATCLVAVAEFDLIDFPRVRDAVDKEAFPFSELLLIGVVADKFLIAGIKPDEGWSAYDLKSVVA
jgi:hypothetical protein